MKTFYFCSADCPRRNIDGQKIFNYLSKNGWEYTEDYESADIIVINTCAVHQKTEDFSMKTIEFYIKNKKTEAKMIISGCLPKINPIRLNIFKDLLIVHPREPEVLDKYLASKFKFKDIPEPTELKQFSLMPSKNKSVSKMPTIFEGLKQAFYLKISDGCVGNCSYCAIRFSSGLLKSRSKEEIIKEFKEGLVRGHKKFALVAGDIGCYGLDLGIDIVDLLREIFSIKGDYKLFLEEFNVQWIIKYYSELEELFKKNHKRIQMIIIPIQSGSDRILELMSRPYNISQVTQCLSKLKKNIPSLKIVTHILVGFPGETEEDFAKTKKLIRDFKFDFIYIYGYSDRPNTRASMMKDKVPYETIEKRVLEIKKIQRNLFVK